MGVNGISATEDDYLNQRVLPEAQTLAKHSDNRTVMSSSAFGSACQIPAVGQSLTAPVFVALTHFSHKDEHLVQAE